MIEAKSAGVVLFHGNPRKFLLLHYPQGHWDFPKGHVEPGETEQQTALRELEEETGISIRSVLEGFRMESSYYYTLKGETVRKVVVYFLGSAPSMGISLSEEHKGFKWLSFVNSMKNLTFDNSRNILKKSQEFLDTNLKL